MLQRAGCIVVGEVAQTHDGSLGLAHAFIDAIADTGADAVKFQTHIARAESTPGEPWRTCFSLQDETRYAYWRRMQFSESQWAGLKAHADDRDLLFLSSPFSIEAVQLLAALDVAAWKIPSGEVGNLPLLDIVTRYGRPVLVSSGISDIAELDAAVARAKAADVPVAVMQCTSAYPCPPEKVGLNLVPFFRRRYGSFVGLSDHSGTPYPALAAAFLGADIVEVHVTFSRAMFGPDVIASVTMSELREMVNGIRFIEAMNQHPVDKDALGSELLPLRRLFTKSVVATTDLDAGTVLTVQHLTTKKPGTGIPPVGLPRLIGTRLRRDVRADELILDSDVESLT